MNSAITTTAITATRASTVPTIAYVVVDGDELEPAGAAATAVLGDTAALTEIDGALDPEAAEVGLRAGVLLADAPADSDGEGDGVLLGVGESDAARLGDADAVSDDDDVIELEGIIAEIDTLADRDAETF